METHVSALSWLKTGNNKEKNFHIGCVIRKLTPAGNKLTTYS
jgi:hypothetical protein